MQLNLEIEKAIEKINQSQARLVCIQLPDGLKPKAEEIQKDVEKNTQAKAIFWSGSCFGACDIPQNLDKLDFDLIIQFGHTEWDKKLI